MNLNEECRRCDQRLRNLLLLAMMCDAGAQATPSPEKCWDGNNHIWTGEKQPILETEEAGSDK